MQHVRVIGLGLWSVFVFWRSGTSAHVEVSILFFVWVFCPSVVSLFFLVAVAGNCSLLLVAAAGVSLLGALWLLPGLGCFWFGGWGRFFLIGVLGPGLSPFVFVVVIGVSFLALWDFCPPCGVRFPPLSGCGLGLFVFRLFGASARSGVYLPFGGCGWHAGASACFAVFLVPFGCCVGHLSFGASSLLVSSARSIFSFSSLRLLGCLQLWFGPSKRIVGGKHLEYFNFINAKTLATCGLGKKQAGCDTRQICPNCGQVLVLFPLIHHPRLRGFRATSRQND